MGIHEAIGKSDDWYTPRYIFDALGVEFDPDVSAPPEGPRHVPARLWLHENSLETPWHGFVWMNPPYGGRNGIEPWLAKFFDHANGIALVPDRTSAPWWQRHAPKADSMLFVDGKIKFERPDGTLGKQPGNGTCLFACGDPADLALQRAHLRGLGTRVRP